MDDIITLDFCKRISDEEKKNWIQCKIKNIISLDSIPIYSDEEFSKYYFEKYKVIFTTKDSRLFMITACLLLGRNNISGGVYYKEILDYDEKDKENYIWIQSSGDTICNIITNINEGINVKYILKIGNLIFETDNLNKLINFENQLQILALPFYGVRLKIIAEVNIPIIVTIIYCCYTEDIRELIRCCGNVWHNKVICSGCISSTMETDDLECPRLLLTRSPYKKIYDRCMASITKQAIKIKWYSEILNQIKYGPPIINKKGKLIFEGGMEYCKAKSEFNKYVDKDE